MRRARTGSVWLAVVLLSVFGSGCGGDNGPASPTPTATATLSAAPTETSTPRLTPTVPSPPAPTITPTPALTNINIRALHAPSSAQYDRDCLSCHAEVLNEQTLSPEVPGIHPVMVSVLGEVANTTCVECHTSVDLDGGSAGNVRRNVRVEKCALCHSVGYPGRKYYYFDD
jgi:hypothetical protein